MVKYCILRLRREHPRWGPDNIREHLEKRRSLRGLALPSLAQIGRYLHQWLVREQILFLQVSLSLIICITALEHYA
jgi:hypothetical protein